MKKFLTLLFTLLLTTSFISPITDASTYTLKNQQLKLPNLYSYSNAKAMKNASFKYYGLKLRQNQPTMLKTWGNPANTSVVRSSGLTTGDYIYGKDWNVSVFTQAYGTKAPKSKYIIDSIVITQLDSKYELSKVKKYFGNPTTSYVSKSYISYDYNNRLSISFTKKGSKFYADTINMYHFVW